jgi:hypothetical protein
MQIEAPVFAKRSSATVVYILSTSEALFFIVPNVICRKILIDFASFEKAKRKLVGWHQGCSANDRAICRSLSRG